MLERRVHVERDARAGREVELRPDDRREGRGGRAQRGAAHAERAEEDLHPRAVDRGDGEVGVVLERGRVREAVARQRDPQLDAVQDRGRSPRGDSSEWEMPRPAVMRLSSPGRTVWSDPTASRCRISPANSHVTVWSPVWGAAAPACRRCRRRWRAAGRGRSGRGSTTRPRATGRAAGSCAAPASPGCPRAGRPGARGSRPRRVHRRRGARGRADALLRPGLEVAHGHERRRAGRSLPAPVDGLRVGPRPRENGDEAPRSRIPRGLAVSARPRGGRAGWPVGAPLATWRPGALASGPGARAGAVTPIAVGLPGPVGTCAVARSPAAGGGGSSTVLRSAVPSRARRDVVRSWRGRQTPA